MTKALGQLLTEIGQASGLDRLAAIAASAGPVIGALDSTRNELGSDEFVLTGLCELQNTVLAQILFYGQRRWESDDETPPMELIDIPGLTEDLERLVREAVVSLPDVARRAADELYPSHPWEDTLAVFWLGEDVGPGGIPPGHDFWMELGVSDKGEWHNLTEDEKVTRVLRSLRRDRLSLARTMLRLACHAFERGSRPKEKTESFESLTEKNTGHSDLQRTIRPFWADNPTDAERLEKFAELAGIDIEDLTPKETERVLDLLDFHDWGGQKSSKTGVSFKEYYGGNSDSEKTQRNRLFKKIRRLTQEPTLQER